jgi:ABC-type lipoprotein release transport system permease subunit
MLTFKIAWRNIFRQKRRTLLTMLTMFGGFVLASISIGWSDGSYNNIIDLFTRNRLGHVQIHRVGYLDRPALYKSISRYHEVGQVVEQTEGVEAWTPRLYSAGLVSVGEKSAGARIIGIEPGHENEATRFDKKIIRGRSLSPTPNHEAILGKNLARTLEADTGQEIVVVSQGVDGSIANDLFTIVGIVKSGDPSTDQSGFILHLSEAQELLMMEDRVHELVVIAADLGEVGEVTAGLRTNLADSTLAVCQVLLCRDESRSGWFLDYVVCDTDHCRCRRAQHCVDECTGAHARIWGDAFTRDTTGTDHPAGAL